MKKILIAVILCLAGLHANAQFVTIMGEEETVANDTIGTEFAPMEEDWDDEDEDDPEKKQRKKGIKRLFDRIGGWLGLKKAESAQDTVPTDPALFSYDEVEGKGTFIFTEADEKRYLDSIKYELIKRRHLVLKRKAMVSMPMEQLRVTSYFGYRKDPFTKAMKLHNGIDFAARNYFVNAVLPGLVIYAGYRGGYGYCVELKHGDVHTLYAHLSYILVQKNQPVPAGEPIGISGTTGRSTGEHLHFSVINKGKFIDPLPMLDYLSSILAEEQPMEEEFYLPEYSELKQRGKEAEAQAGTPVLQADSLQQAGTAAGEAETAPRRTSGRMILPKEGREAVEGKVYTHGRGQGTGTEDKMAEDGRPIIRYSDREGQSQETPAGGGGIIHYSGKGGKRIVAEPEQSPIQGGKGTEGKEGLSLPPMTRAKSGIILPEGDSTVTVKPLKRKP